MDESKHPGAGHEERDVNVLSITKAGLGVGGLVLVAVFLMWYLFDQFAAREMSRSPRPEPMASSNPAKVPPEPRLEPAPVRSLQEYRRAEEVILNQYAWVDPAMGIVRIPVDRALEVVAKEGLPSRGVK